jgi:lipopolysaccharide export system protein LptA
MSLVIAGTILVPASLWALPDDQQQPIRIQSNSAEIDDNKGVSIYRGDVNVIQGSIKVLADTVTVHNGENGITKVVAVGAPAHYQQQREIDSTVTNAYGNIVEYRIIDQFIRIHKNAKLEEDGNSFSGERIDYDMKHRTVKAYSDTNAPSGDKSSRVEIIIQPRAAPDNKQADNEPPNNQESNNQE